MKFFNYFILSLMLFLFSCDSSENKEEEIAGKKIIVPDPVNVTYDGNIYLACKINDSTDANLMFDTGAYGLLLDSFYCSQNCPKYNEVPFVGSRNTKLKEKRLLPKISFQELNYTPDRFWRADLKSIFGKKIDGIVGVDFLRRYVVEINYNSPSVKIISPNDFRPDSSFKKAELKWTGNKLLAYLRLNVSDNLKIKGNFIFDTGFTGSVLLSNKAGNKYRLDTINNEKVKWKMAHSTLLGKATTTVFKIKSGRLKEFELYQPIVGYENDTTGLLNYNGWFGLLGNRFLERFDLVLDFPNSMLYLKPNKKFSENFVSRSTGFGLTDRTDICEGWMVNGMILNSEADKIGIKQGDIVTHINNKRVSEFSKFQMKKMRKQEGAEILYTIKRGNKILKFNLKLKRYL